MCGRFTLRTAPATLGARLAVTDWPDGRAPTPRYNIAPGQAALCVRAEGPAWMRFGLPPARSAGSGAAAAGEGPGAARRPRAARLRINARSETVFTTPSFRGPVRRQRCLVLADGFYEWQRVGRGRQAFHFRLASGGLFGFAGVWTEAEASAAIGGADGVLGSEGGVFGPKRGILGSKAGIFGPAAAFAILTMASDPPVASVHDRMPVILTEPVWSAWLDPTRRELSALQGLLSAPPQEGLVAVAVGPRVNDSRVDDLACLAPAPPQPVQLGFGW